MDELNGMIKNSATTNSELNEINFKRALDRFNYQICFDQLQENLDLQVRETEKI